MPDSIDVCALQLPGRENRLRDPKITDLRQLVEVMAESLWWAFDLPFAFFGHSMGALIAYELAERIRAERALCPIKLVVSARRAPDLIDEEEQGGQGPGEMTDDQLMAKLRRLNTEVEASLLNPDLREIFLPVYRADLALLYSYQFRERPPLACPIVAYGGIQDESVTKEQLNGWRRRTGREFIVRMFPGDHFFVKNQRALLLQTLARDLADYA